MKGLVTIAVTMLSIWSSGSRADTPATHGMLLFGNQKSYASHLPMFHAPHDYQVIMEVSIGAFPHSIAHKKYNELKGTTDKIFTLEPLKMDLTKVLDGSITSFQADLYHGHFEKGGDNLGPVNVKVVHLIVGNKLNPQPAALSMEKYVVFGSSGEYFAAHAIEGKPSFDAIVTVKQPYTISAKVCTGRACPPPVKVPIADVELPIILSGPTALPGESTLLGDFGGVMTSVQKVNYLEQDELAH